MSKNENKTPGFRNYDKWMGGYQPFLKWLINELKCIRTNKPTTTEEEWSKLSHTLLNSILKGAIALQYVGDQDFYHNDEDIEILIRFKKDYTEMTKDEIVFNLMKDVILVLEQEEHQLLRIANSYDKRRY